MPDPLSLRLITPISLSEAERVRSDHTLREECVAAGIDLEAIVGNLQLSGPQRVKATQSILHELDIFRILYELTSRGIRFMLIGGLAGRVYGSTYVTNDFDVCHARDPENLRAIAGMLRDIDAVYRRQPKHTPPNLDERTLSTEMDFVFTTRFGHFDLIGEFTGVGTYEDAIDDAVTLEIAQQKLQVLSAPKLMSAKKSTGRPKDMLVFTELETVTKVREKLDGVPCT